MDLIYLNGGKGKRAKLGYPKQYLKINGKYCFLFGLEVFCDMKEIENIIIATQDEFKIRNILSNYNLINKKNFIFCQPGDTRQESTYNALKEVKTDFVLVGESVRPFITKEFVSRIIKNKHDFVTPIANSKSTVLDSLNEVHKRENIGEVQTPQKFKTDILRKSHDIARDYNLKSIFTDDTAIVKIILKKEVIIKVIKGIEENIKITTPLDIAIARAIYNYKNPYMKLGED